MRKKLRISAAIMIVLATFMMITAQAAEMNYPDEVYALTESYFKDVNSRTKYYDDIMTLATEGVITGDGTGNFHPDRIITFPEALTMVEKKYGNPNNLPKTWNDWSSTGEDGYTGTWYKLMEGPKQKLSGEVSRRDAAYLTLTIRGVMPNLNLQLMIGGEVVTSEKADSYYVTASLLGYDGRVISLEHIRSGISRAEFCHMLVWGEAVQGVPKGDTPDYPIEVHVKSALKAEEEKLVRSEIDAAFNKIPNQLRNSFALAGYSYDYYTKRDYETHVSDRPHLYTSVAYYSHNHGEAGKIVISNTKERTVIHEFGHFIDYQTDYKLETEKLYKNKTELDGVVKTIGIDYATTNVEEFFADAFASYILHPNELKTNAPLTYAMIDKVISEWIGS